jgi:S-adenosylmethionine decarboxylase
VKIHVALAVFEGAERAQLDDRAAIDRCLRAGVDAGGFSLRKLVTVAFDPHGVTGTAVVGESHLSIHTWPEEGRAFVDVASCKDREGVRRAVAAMLEVFPGARLAQLDEREVG